MNNDPTTSPPAATTSNAGESSQHDANAGQHATAQKRAREMVLEQLKKRLEFSGHILTNIDMLIYAELCALYYMDNSFFRLVFRSLSQTLFLTPKPADLPALPKHAPYVPGLLVPNVFCILIHLFTSLPYAGELTRGYLHGSVTIDFIGEKVPGSKFKLLVMDLVILCLQVFMLAVHVESERVKAVIKNDGLETGTPNNTSSTSPDMVPGQDHDAEERGIVRELARPSSNDIEMTALPSSSRNNDTQEATAAAEETERLLEATVGQAAVNTPEGALDAFYAGDLVVADFHILHTLRSVRNNHAGAGETALQSVGSSTAYNWARMQQRLSRLQAA